MKISQKKNECIKYINLLSLDKRIKIADLIVLKVDKSAITIQADGTRILLDQIEDNTIHEIWSLINNQLKK